MSSAGIDHAVVGRELVRAGEGGRGMGTITTTTQAVTITADLLVFVQA
jgi:hypothetical protein